MAGKPPASTFFKIPMKYIFLAIMHYSVIQAMQHSVVVHVINNTPLPVRINHIAKAQTLYVPGMESEQYYLTPLKNNELYQLHLKISGDYFRAAFLAYTVYEKKHNLVITKQLVRDSKKIKYRVRGSVYQQQKEKIARGTLQPQLITLIINNNQKPLLSNNRFVFTPEIVL